VKTILLSLFIFNFCAVFSQVDTIKNGAYRNCVEFRKNDPSYECEFIVSPKVYSSIPGLCRVKPVDGSINGRILRRAIWGIYCDSTFYLNLRRIGMTKGYVALREMDKYSYFKGIPMYNMYQKKKLHDAQVGFGLIGYAVADAIIMKEIRDNDNYILNFETGQVNLITPGYVHRILSEYPALQAVFELEEDKSNSQLMRYIQLVNEGDKLKMDSLLNTP
jgi:hypothetical protein